MNKEQRILEQLNQIEQFIQSGSFKTAQKAIHELRKRARIKRLQSSTLANQARRAGLPLTSLKILRPYIFKNIFKNELSPQASSTELALYGAALVAIGAIKEGLRFLKMANASENPEVYLHSSLAYFQLWNYAKSIPLLEKYMKHPRTTSYQKLVGQVNLAAALIGVARYHQADACIAITLPVVENEKNIFLLGSLLELKAQSLYLQKKYQDALIHLDQAESFLQNTTGFYLIYVKKWKALVQHQLQLQTNSHNLKRTLEDELQPIRQLAKLEKNWETLRDCDLQQGLLQQNFYLLSKVYFGTPYSSYRERVFQLFPKDYRLPAEFYYSDNLASSNANKPTAADQNQKDLNPNWQQPQTTRIFDQPQSQPIRILDPYLMYEYTNKLAGESLVHTQILKLNFNENRFIFDEKNLQKKQLIIPDSSRRALLSLLTDLYKPLRLGSFFASQFPDEYFNPYSSPSRLAKVSARLNVWLKQNNIPMRIENNKSQFFLKLTDDHFLIKIKKSLRAHDTTSVELKKLQKHFGQKPFSSAQAAAVLKKSLRSVQRLLQTQDQNQIRATDSQKNSFLKSLGQGKSKRYFFNRN